MIKACVVLALSVLGVGNAVAQDYALITGGESPNKKYRVEVTKTTDEYAATTVGVRLAKGGETIGDEVDGYACFEVAKEPGNTLALWSPGSKFVAIKWCEGKRERAVLLAHVAHKMAAWIKSEDYMQRILHELKSDSINRFENNTPNRWLSDTELVIDIVGDCIVGDRATGQWKIFHYEVCIDVSTGKIEWIKQLEVKAEEG